MSSSLCGRRYSGAGEHVPARLAFLKGSLRYFSAATQSETFLQGAVTTERHKATDINE
jgi:hypothetical protein